MTARIAVLGATGSIGRQALEVVAAHRDRLAVTGLSCRASAEACAELAQAHGARVIVSERDGVPAVLDLARAADVDLVVIGIPGIAALPPTLAALEAGKAVAIAAKEVLVTAGHLVRRLVPEGAGERLRPIDSEHCALWQCLRGEDRDAVESVTLTASGGPFRDTPLEELPAMRASDALRHPTWQMGPKVTIDSATLVNKGFEVIEAHWLFDLPYDRVGAVIHPESVVHSLVQFRDGSVKAQLAFPDMRLPIQYALLFPERIASPAPRIDWLAAPRGRMRMWPEQSYRFRPVNAERYPAFGVVLEAARRDAAATVAVNAADEVAVGRFLRGEISFPAIAELLERALALAARARLGAAPDLGAILAFDAEVRQTLSARAAV